MNSHRTWFGLMLAGALLVYAGCACTASPATATALPSPILATATPELLSREHTPEPDSGIVHGLLSMTGEPAAGKLVYLAAIIHREGEGMGVAALDVSTAPQTESDASGYFVFLGVPPASYALGILGPAGPLLIQQATGTEILVQVEAGQVYDLGEIQLAPFAQ